MTWNPEKPVEIKKEITLKFLVYVKEFNPGRVFNCFLCMPSTTAQDVAKARDVGIIDENTKIIAIERNKKWVKEVKSALLESGYGCDSIQVIEKELIETTADDFEEAMDKLGVDNIDLVYLDTCNCATASLREWVNERLNPLCSSDAIVCTNLQAARWVPVLKQYDKEHWVSNLYKPFNPYAGQIANFWEKETGRKTTLVLGYKEKGVRPVMVLCVNQASALHELMNNPRQLDAMHLIKNSQNLGYNKRKD